VKHIVIRVTLEGVERDFKQAALHERRARLRVRPRQQHCEETVQGEPRGAHRQKQQAVRKPAIV